MSALSRFGPSVAKPAIVQMVRHQNMATAASAQADPIQRLFVEKIRDLKTSNQGLDEAHKRVLEDETARLKRVYRIDDESKLAQLNYKFSKEVDVSLRDLDENKEHRAKMISGDYAKEASTKLAKPSDLLATIKPQITPDCGMTPSNKPDPTYFLKSLTQNAPSVPQKEGTLDDYMTNYEKVTVEKLEDMINVRFGEHMATVDDDKKPERDTVNFPRYQWPDDCPPTRHYIVPESWFQFLYPKIGLTGPYTLATGFSLFIFSKEWIALSHDVITGSPYILVFGYLAWKFGDRVKSYFVNTTKKQIDDWENWRQDNIKLMNDLRDHYRGELDMGKVVKDIYDVRRQDVELQAEGEYRRRVKHIYDDTKRRLNYLVALADAQRTVAYKNMVNNVIASASAAFGPKQEAEVLDNCIVNLKKLASANARAI